MDKRPTRSGVSRRGGTEDYFFLGSFRYFCFGDGILFGGW